MHLIIDGYNLLLVGRLQRASNPDELRRDRDRLIEQLSVYRRSKPCEVTVVFDGWQGGWPTETREVKKGIQVIFSKMGERADEVVKRLAKEKGQAAVVITSDREVSRFAERLDVAVIPSDRFKDKMERSQGGAETETDDEDERSGMKRKGPSRRLSKKEKRSRAALKKL